MEQGLQILTVISEVIISGGGLIAVISALVEHSKSNNYKPISWFFNHIGQLMTRGVMDEVKEVNGKMEIRIKDEIESVRKQVVEKEINILNKIDENKKESDFKDDSGWANFIRLQIKTVVKNMRNNERIPDDQELAREYYDMILWYEDFCAKHENDDKYKYANNKMNLACKYYKEWYEENWE